MAIINSNNKRCGGWIDLFGSNRKFRILSKKLEQLALSMEKSKIADYVYYLDHPKKMMISNFVAGLARGFGAAIGFTILAALIVYILQWIVRWNLPFIGEFISEIVNIVENNLRNVGGKTGV